MHCESRQHLIHFILNFTFFTLNHASYHKMGVPKIYLIYVASNDEAYVLLPLIWYCCKEHRTITRPCFSQSDKWLLIYGARKSSGPPRRCGGLCTKMKNEVPMNEVSKRYRSILLFEAPKTSSPRGKSPLCSPLSAVLKVKSTCFKIGTFFESISQISIFG